MVRSYDLVPCSHADCSVLDIALLVFYLNSSPAIELSSKMDVLVKVISTSSGLIGATGVFTNSLSLSYFIGGTEKSLSSQLFVLLNMFDLLVCTSDVLSVAFLFCNGFGCGPYNFPFRLSFALFDLSIESTAFATCLLGVVRVISVRFPFHHINKRTVAVIAATFLGQEIFRASARFYFFYKDVPKLGFYIEFDNAVMIVLLTLFVLINSISSILLAWELLTKTDREDDSTVNQESVTASNRRATVTVLILSVFFLFFNTIFGLCLYLEIFIENSEEVNLNDPVRLLSLFTLWLAIPLNSALNPLIYFLRRRRMRQHVQELPGRILRRVTRQQSARRSVRAPTSTTEMRTVGRRE